MVIGPEKAPSQIEREDVRRMCKKEGTHRPCSVLPEYSQSDGVAIVGFRCRRRMVTVVVGEAQVQPRSQR